MNVFVNKRKKENKMMRWKTKKTIMWIILLITIIFIRECKHAEREYNYRERITQLEYEIDDLKADAYNDGFNACLEQF